MDHLATADGVRPWPVPTLRRVEAGDLLSDLYPGLWRYTAAACGASFDPDDVLQEALTRTLAVHTLEDLDHPAAYIRKAVLSVIVDEARSPRMRRSTLTPVVADAPAANPTEYPSDLADLLRLTPPDRALLYLVEVERFDFTSAAAVLGCSPATARKRASRARVALRSALEGDD